MGNLEKTLENIKKKYGAGSILRGNEAVKDVETISTQCIALDSLLVGGFPKSAITEVYGQEGTGKSTLAAHVVAQAQKEGGVCVYIDTEYAVNSEYFKSIGVDFDSTEKFMLCQPTSAEEGLSILEMLLDSQEVSVILIDSVAALVPQVVLDGEIGDQTIGQLARLMSTVMGKLAAKVSKSKTAIIFINQLRSNIGTMGYGPKYTTPGGKALPYYSNVRIELARTGAVKDGESIIGSRIKAKIIKSKIASPFKEAEYDLIFGEGISSDRDLIEQAIKNGIINKGGAWLTYGDLKIQGTEKLRLYLKENPAVKEKLRVQVIGEEVQVANG